MKVPPWVRAEEGLGRAVEQLEHEDWERNVDGLTSLLRLVHHTPDFVVLHYSQLMHLLLRQVKNLRSQVARAAIYTLADMFDYLKRSMEGELEKVNIHRLIDKIY